MYSMSKLLFGVLAALGFLLWNHSKVLSIEQTLIGQYDEVADLEVICDNHHELEERSLEISSNPTPIPSSAETETETSEQNQSLQVQPNPNNDNNNPNKKEEGGKFAYAYIVSGCTAHSCLGYILNVIVAAQVLYTHHSRADVVLLVRMKSDSDDKTLDPQHEAWLKAMGNIRLAYLPQVEVDNFGTAVLEKFRILEMVEYDRVLFMDGDVTPFCSMDYALEESYKPDGVLGPYTGVAGAAAPITAALMLMTPREGLFQQVLDIVSNAIRANNSTFDPIRGWGYVIPPNDPWESLGAKGATTWDFKAGASDQGILLYFLKYHVLNYTEIFYDRIDTWQQVFPHHAENFNATGNVKHAPNGKFITKTKSVPFRNLQHVEGCTGLLTKKKPNNNDNNHNNQGTTSSTQGSSIGRAIPEFTDTYVDRALKRFGDNWWYRNYQHFASKNKPWRLVKPLSAQVIRSVSSPDDITDQLRFWVYHLNMANRTNDLRMPDHLLINAKGEKGTSSNPLGLADSSRQYGRAGGHLFQTQVQLPRAGGWKWKEW